MKIEVMLITPKMAQEFLKKNAMNRFIRASIVQEYTRQMVTGLWRENTGEAIKFASDGTLMDGQHRLDALIKAEKSLSFLVVSGLEKEDFLVLDTGYKRSPSDVLHIAGISNSTTLAGGIRSYWNLKTKRLLSMSRGISNAEIYNLYYKSGRSKFWDSCGSMAMTWYTTSQRLLSPSEFVGFFAYFHDVNEDDAFSFMSTLAEGTRLEKSDPIYLLREKLNASRANPKFKLKQSIRYAFIIKTWNLYRTKREIRSLRYDPNIESYPEAK